MSVEQYLPKVFMKAMDELAVTTLDEALGKKLHSRILERVFNAQSEGEIQEYQKMKRSRMTQQDNSRMDFRPGLLAEAERSKANKRRMTGESTRILFPESASVEAGHKRRRKKIL